ncbi:aldo/keto reductase [Portibacter lacus]|uniref:Oxidoreductase n=1 Tax=Portibacter lacus TaxID=1099794 RepID=A0AA37WF09_9BACT|nr:aldo/keto reductase [Portibacter lacus]GLR16500.1 oxidoreductase [Portibacter lacus]
MKKKNLLGFGTAAIGRPQYINIKQNASSDFSLPAFKDHAFQMLDQAYDLNILYFDTAPGYGIAEDLLIEWLETKDDARIEIATKWGYTYVANFDPNAKIHEVKEHSLSKLNEQWEKSQALLPYLTTYQIHSATLETGVLENEAILYQLLELKEEFGLIMGVSVSGANQNEILKKAFYAEIGSVQLFDTFQVTYNVFDQSLSQMSELLASDDKRIIIKEALANGRIFPNDRYPNYTKTYELLRKLAAKYQVGIDAIALRFCMDSMDVFKVLSGASEATHLTQNNLANTITLLESEIEQLRSFAIPPDVYWSERKQLEWQ